jgi:hypothetical protein
VLLLAGTATAALSARAVQPARQAVLSVKEDW